MTTSFKERYSLQERIEKCQKQRQDNPDKIVLIVSKKKKSIINDLSNPRFLVQEDLKFKNIIQMISKKVQNAMKDIGSPFYGAGFYLTLNNIHPNPQSSILQLHSQYHDEDGMLYLQYSYSWEKLVKQKPQIPYKQQFTLEQRIEKFTKISSQNPDKVVLIVSKNKKSKLYNLNNPKFLIQKDFNFHQFKVLISQRVKELQITLTAHGMKLDQKRKMIEIYEEHKDEDGILYLEYCEKQSPRKSKMLFLVMFIIGLLLWFGATFI